MSSPTDQQLVQYIGQGRRDALAQLFDKYSADLYDYLTRLVGDRDQAARLLDTVFMRIPGAAPGFQPRDSVRGWIYSIARETGLDWLRQRGWLDGLPPSDEAIPPGLQGDVWKAARAMPAFFRAVLITEELQPLSPTEKARALGVNRTDLSRLIEEARRSFNRIYDAQARTEGRPTSDRINTETVWNARQRLPVEGGSLFGFLPLVEFPDSLKQNIRRHVLDAMNPVAAAPANNDPFNVAAAAAAAATVAAVRPGTNGPPNQPVAAVPPPVPPPPPSNGETTKKNDGAFGWPIAALIGVALALLICGGIFLLLQNRNALTITSLQPPNGSTIQQSPEINVFASYTTSGTIDPTKSGMQIDGSPVVPEFISSSIAWAGPLNPGSHQAAVSLIDTGGRTATQTWTFLILDQNLTPGAPGTPGTPSGVASVTPIVPVTADVLTVTPIVVPGTPTPPFFTPSFPTFAPPPTQQFPTLIPCTQGGVAGFAFNDLNSNGVRDPNEPGVAGVVINLLTQTNSIFAQAVSDTFGNYRLNNIPFGQYRVQANTPAGWTPTTATLYPVNLFGCGTVSGFNFGYSQNVLVTPTWTPIVITPTFTPPSAGVVAVSAFVTPTSSTTCPQTFTFNGAITTNGAATVTYQWARNDGYLGPIQAINFASAGTQNVVPDSYTVGGPPPFNANGWARIQVLSPNAINSPLANWTLNCVAPATSTATVTLTPIVPTPTDTPTLPPPFSVTAANAAVTPAASVTCPENFAFSGDITSTGPGTVNYNWAGADSLGNTYTGPASTLTFLIAGTQPLTIPYSIPYTGPGPLNVTGSAHIHVTSPNVFDSPNAAFTLACP